jgi:hypothetical protein
LPRYTTLWTTWHCIDTLAWRLTAHMQVLVTHASLSYISRGLPTTSKTTGAANSCSGPKRAHALRRTIEVNIAWTP